MVEYPKIQLRYSKAPKSRTRIGLEQDLMHCYAQTRPLYAFLYAFDHFFGGKRSKKKLKALKDAYNELYPKCLLHEQGKYCECPWTDVGWIVNRIKINGKRNKAKI